jgi:AraC-like DNA-binding protein
MNIKDVALPEKVNASIDETKNRIEIYLTEDCQERIIAYYPIENLQVYIYEISGSNIPDMWELGLRKNYTGRYMRILICRNGRGEFIDNGLNLNISGGEFALKSGIESVNRFDYSADSLVGIEIVLQDNKAVKESFVIKILDEAMKHIKLSSEDFQNDKWYFSNYSEKTEKSVEHLLANCANNADSNVIMINGAEIVYNLGHDYKSRDFKERRYSTKPQKAIAEDIHRQLSEHYNERLTADVFAEKYGLSDTTVKNYFKNEYGYSFKEYRTKVRMEKAAELLEKADMKQVEIEMAVGYSTQAKFIGAFKKYYNLTPSEYRRIKSSAIFLKNSKMHIFSLAVPMTAIA